MSSLYEVKIQSSLALITNNIIFTNQNLKDYNTIAKYVLDYRAMTTMLFFFSPITAERTASLHALPLCLNSMLLKTGTL
jgi:hypothetical protein